MPQINVNTPNKEKWEQAVEAEIKLNKKEFDFDIREYPLEVIAMKFEPSDPDVIPDMYIPDYQRDFIWSEKQKSLLIESLLIGLPIPYVFIADLDESEQGDGRSEIVDGAQRIQTVNEFIKNRLTLIGMERILSLEGKKFSELPIIRQRRFLKTTLRMIELIGVNEDGRRLMFNRLNSGGTQLRPMEKRIGALDTTFLKFIKAQSLTDKFVELTPMSDVSIRGKERVEYALRFFAYLQNYQSFNKSVNDFLNSYIQEMDDSFDEAELSSRLQKMLLFVEKHFPYGFRRAATVTNVSRIRFEATAVGTALALIQSPELEVKPNIDTTWAYEGRFLQMMRSDASNSRPKVIERIEYVRDQLLKQV